MSRIAKNPIPVPTGVEISFDGNLVKVAGSKDKMEFLIPASVSANHADDFITISYDEESSQSTALAGTTRSLINNMIVGVTEGYTKTLILVGVGYRAKANGKKLELTLAPIFLISYNIFNIYWHNI